MTAEVFLNVNCNLNCGSVDARRKQELPTEEQSCLLRSSGWQQDYLPAVCSMQSLAYSHMPAQQVSELSIVCKHDITSFETETEAAVSCKPSQTKIGKIASLTSMCFVCSVSSLAQACKITGISAEHNTKRTSKVQAQWQYNRNPCSKKQP